MSNVERGYMPLSRVEIEEPADIYVDLTLPPFIDKDRIGFNVGRIDRLKKIAGIRDIVIVGSTEDNASHEIPNIAGQNSDGSAIAAKSTAKVNVPTFQNVGAETGDSYNRRRRQIDLGVIINLNEVSQKITRGDEGARSPKPWANEIDSGLRTSIGNSGFDNLTTKGKDPFPDWGYFGINFAIFSDFAFAITNVLNNNPGGALRDVGWATALIAINNLGKMNKIPDYRFSIFAGAQWDRAITLKTLTKTQTLVKDLHPDKK